MSFLIRQTLVYAVPLMLVALAGVYAERSGIINLALEGIMIFGAFMGVLFVRLVQQWGWFAQAYADKQYVALQGFMPLSGFWKMELSPLSLKGEERQMSAKQT